MMRRWTITAVVFVSLSAGLLAQDAQPDSCDLTFEGKARKAVKLRPPAAGMHYKKLKSGKPMTTEEWFETMCEFDSELPSTIPAAQPMPGLENRKVILRGFLMGAKFEREGDQDIHAEIAGSEDWDDPHVVVEVPPGQTHCEARKALWALVRADFEGAGKSDLDRWIMTHPVEVDVTGFVFLDSAHGTTDTCTKNGGRGLRKKKGGSKVEGLWEVHPVIKIETVGD
jgi:hypothetical protein